MSVLHYWPIYLGAAAAAMPIVVHWLTRPRPRQLPLSTLRFVREVLQQRKARSRLRDVIILALRTAAILLLAAAVARPLWSGRQTLDSGAQGQVARVVLLDASQSMAAGRKSIQNFERARARAAEQLVYRPGLRANLILAAAAARPVFEQISTNFSALHDSLDRCRVLPQRLNAPAAIALAGEMLAGAGAEQRRELIVISDFQRTNWAAADFASLPADTQIRLESVAAAPTPANLAIVRAGLQGPANLGKQARLEVEVANYSPDARPIRCEATIGDAAYSLQGVVPAGGKTTLAQDVSPSAAGWQSGEARLVDTLDALAADDVRSFVVEVRPAPLVVLVTRQRADATGSSTFYLERALAPYGNLRLDDAPGGAPSADATGGGATGRDALGGDATGRDAIGGGAPSGGAPSAGAPSRDARRGDTLRVMRIEPEQLDSDAVLAAPLLVIDHPGKLSADAARFLASLLRRGRAVWYVAAEPIDAMNLKQLAELSGAGWQLPVEFVPPGTGRPRQNLFLADVKRNQAPFSLWGDAVIGAMESLRFGGGLGSRRLATGLGDDLVASYSDGSAALVICSAGAGVLAVLNADLAHSNLPSSPLFVPLVAELSDRLLGDRRRGAAAPSGEPLAVYLPPEAGAAAGLKIVGPTTAAPTSPIAAGASSPRTTPELHGDSYGDSIGELVEEGAGVLWRAAAAPAPGVYRAQRGASVVLAVATEIPPEESDLAPLSGDLLAGRLAGGRQAQYRDLRSDDDAIDDLWTWLASAAVVGLLAEFAALRVYRV